VADKKAEKAKIVAENERKAAAEAKLEADKILEKAE